CGGTCAGCRYQTGVLAADVCGVLAWISLPRIACDRGRVVCGTDTGPARRLHRPSGPERCEPLREKTTPPCRRRAQKYRWMRRTPGCPPSLPGTATGAARPDVSASL